MRVASSSRHALVTIAVAALLTAGIVTAHLEDHARATGPGATAAARGIVQDPHASFNSLVISPIDPAVRATHWDVCPVLGPCGEAETAMSITDDGFATSRSFRGASEAVWAGGDTFVVVFGRTRVALASARSPTASVEVTDQTFPPSSARCWCGSSPVDEDSGRSRSTR